MSRPDNDPSIENEPHLRPGGFETDPSESVAARNIDDASRKEGDDDQVEHTVWDEPGLSSDLAGQVPDHALNYSRWLENRVSSTSTAYCWAIAIAIAVASGPWAILGTFLGGGQSRFGVVMIIVFGPVLEEMMKVAIPLWVVEKRPFLFRSRWQIAVCVLASGLVFSAVENVLYLRIYVAEPSELLIYWRWSVCVGLHTGCSLIGGLGLMRIWGDTMAHRTRPRIHLGVPYLTSAMILHGAYNTFAVLLEFFDFQI